MLSNKLLGVRRESDEERSRKDFSELNSEVFYPFPSSAGIERDFSTAGLVLSKLSNRLGVITY